MDNAAEECCLTRRADELAGLCYTDLGLLKYLAAKSLCTMASFRLILLLALASAALSVELYSSQCALAGQKGGRRFLSFLSRLTLLCEES